MEMKKKLRVCPPLFHTDGSCRACTQTLPSDHHHYQIIGTASIIPACLQPSTWGSHHSCCPQAWLSATWSTFCCPRRPSWATKRLCCIPTPTTRYVAGRGSSRNLFSLCWDVQWVLTRGCGLVAVWLPGHHTPAPRWFGQAGSRCCLAVGPRPVWGWPHALLQRAAGGRRWAPLPGSGPACTAQGESCSHGPGQHQTPAQCAAPR